MQESPKKTRHEFHISKIIIFQLVGMFGKISAQPHTTLCIQFLDRENNDKNNRLPLEKKDLFYNSMGLCGNFTECFNNN